MICSISHTLRYLLLIAVTLCFLGVSQARAWPDSEVIGASLPTTPRIIAVGDIHGDHNAYRDILTHAGLMDTNCNWTGGATILVQTGDIADRGPDTRRIIECLQRLQVQAMEAGGQVVALVGNHEAMNVYGDLRYVHPGEIAAFVDAGSQLRREAYFNHHREDIIERYRRESPGISLRQIRRLWDEDTPLGLLEHRAAWSPQGTIGRWVANNPVAVRIQGYLFAHGGFSREFAHLSLDELNESAREVLLEQDRSRHTILRHELGPLWYRGHVNGREIPEHFDAAGEIDAVLDRYEASHIIIGHTRHEAGIRVSRSGRLIQIDTGASAAYGGIPSYLRIEDGRFYAHTLSSSVELQVAGRQPVE